mgnify:CR=1 FL=1
MNRQSIQELIQSQENDHNLDQAFFCNEELFDLCQLNSTDKSEIDNCIKEKQTN